MLSYSIRTFVMVRFLVLKQKNIYFEEHGSLLWYRTLFSFLFSLSIESVSTRITKEANLRTLLWTTNSYDSLVRPDDTVNVTITLYPMVLLDLVSRIMKCNASYILPLKIIKIHDIKLRRKSINQLYMYLNTKLFFSYYRTLQKVQWRSLGFLLL